MDKLIVIGDIAWDVVLRPASELVWASDVYGQVNLLAGGAAANVAVWAQRLGADVRLIGKVGDDPLGALMREHLRAEALEADIITSPGEETTRIGIIVRSDGEHAFVTDHSRPLRLAASDLPESLLDGAGAVFLTGYAVFMAGSADFAANLLAAARRRHVAVAFDPASFSLVARHGGRRLLDAVGPLDILLANEEEASALLDLGPTGVASRSAERSYDALLDYASVVVLKQGPQGATAIEPGGTTTAPVTPVRVVDTTGAGDAFDAAFIDAWLRALPIEESLQRANQLGAAVAGRLGAQART